MLPSRVGILRSFIGEAQGEETKVVCQQKTPAEEWALKRYLLLMNALEAVEKLEPTTFETLTSVTSRAGKVSL
jgi:hypothetical protein